MIKEYDRAWSNLDYEASKAAEVGMEKYPVKCYPEHYTFRHFPMKLSRHLFRYMCGKRIDKDGQSHLGAMAFHIMMMLERERGE